jgi:very-short-patch-repair endonuclease
LTNVFENDTILGGGYIMGLDNAKQDGVRFVLSKNHGDTAYFPRCSICGRETQRRNYISGNVYTCLTCKELKHETIKVLSGDLMAGEQEKRLEKAIWRISKVANIEQYRDTINQVKQTFGENRFYQSTEEMMVALELIKRGIKITPQQKVGRYVVDFLLPDEQVVLEIDGPFHKDKKDKERTRDNLIAYSLGLDWEIIRISTELINQNVTKVYKAITTVRKQRKAVRSMHAGQLPEWQTGVAP